jgi:hypothetical protein
VPEPHDLQRTSGGDDNDVNGDPGQRRPDADPVPPLPLIAQAFSEAAGNVDPMDTASFSLMDSLTFKHDARAVWLDDAKRIRDEAVEDALAAVLADFAAQLEEEGQ